MSFSPHAKLGIAIGTVVAIGISGYLIHSEQKLYENRLSYPINGKLPTPPIRQEQKQRDQRPSYPLGASAKNPSSAESTESAKNTKSTIGAKSENLPENKVNELKTSLLPVNTSQSEATQAGSALTPTRPSETKPGCLTFTFEPQNKDLSQFPRHVLKIPTQSLESPNQVCIRVNGIPVRYLSSKKNPNEFTIGPILAKNPKVTIRACQKGVKCLEDCTVPKDEFMEALAGEEDLSVAQNLSTGWSETEQDKKIDRELAHFKKDLQGADESRGLFYQDWKIVDEGSSCERTVAKK